MTEIQAIHHAEQVEAARQEFDEIWKRDVVPVLNQMPPISVRVQITMQRVWWTTFLHAKGL